MHCEFGGKIDSHPSKHSLARQKFFYKWFGKKEYMKVKWFIKEHENIKC